VDGILQLNPGSGGEKEDVEVIDIGGGISVVRQRLQITGATRAEVARVMSTVPTGSEFALVVRPITVASTNATVSKIPVTTNTAVLFAPNPAAKARKIYNDSIKATLYIKEGGLPTLDDFSFPIGPNGFYQFDPVFVGEIGGTWDIADMAGAARLTEEV
jgi:hypothetical protein